MNRFLKAAIENMEQLENGDALDKIDPPPLALDAIAYALIAIAEALHEANESAETEASRQETLALWKVD